LCIPSKIWSNKHLVLKTNNLIKIYKEDSIVQTIAGCVQPNQYKNVHLKGLIGSLDTILAATIFKINHQNHLFIIQDKESAAYFHSDLQALLGDKEVLFFPTSYKRPYQFEEIENANILRRAEILNRINHKASVGELIVTYPEALTEKVINKRSLVKNTFSAKKGETLDIEFLAELLLTYDFEKVDFVYEPGQFAVRGGIVDIYSYAKDLPYRLELFGDEIESIRIFDPVSQLSDKEIKEINIIPNVQTKMLQEVRESFLDYLPRNTKVWIKDYQQTLDVVGTSFEKATESFDTILKNSGEAQVVLSPVALFETSDSFSEGLKAFVNIEFGKRFYLKTNDTFTFDCLPQPSFNQKFDILVESLEENQLKGIANYIVAESQNQLERLRTIFDEINPEVEFTPLPIGLREGFIDKNSKIACYTDHQLFGRFHRYKSKSNFSKSKALTLKALRELQAGDYIVHIDYGIGRFAGLEMVDVKGNKQEAIRLIFRDNDLLYASIHAIHKISKYSGKEGIAPAMSKLGSQEWENKKKKAKRKIKDIANDLISLYAKRKKAIGFSYSQDGFLQAELESSFIYEDTPDQASATNDVKADMQLPHPMDRLVCGDVGFGKTEVAIRAAFKAVTDGKQVAILVPTTILAMQHYHTFKDRLVNFPVDVEYINRFRTAKQIRETLKNVAEGKTDILIGTHRIVNKDVKFKDLGLLVIDEEQKFGVSVKEKLKQFKLNVDTLTLTATPIPRTLHFSLMGARDLSIIATPPPNRQPVSTVLQTFNEAVIRDAISFELQRGGQVFFVHNRVKDIEEVANIILKLVPDARIGVAHGQMQGPQLEKVMLRFIEGEFDVLISTNIIESGLDIPNANTILINQAHMFGLSDLHQMRGRVGRSNKKAFCYLLSPPTIGLTNEARKRLSTLEEFNELGDGFKVAMRDLDIRGAGNLLGGEQSGFINDLGFDTYHKILDEAIQDLKENEFKDLFAEELSEKTKVLVQDCTVETDLEILIPENYVSNISERLNLYSKLDRLKNEEELGTFITSLIDRFGPLPESVIDLTKTVKLRWLAENIGFEKLVLKNENMKCYLMPSDNEAYYRSEVFGKILQYVQTHPKKCKLREHKKRLILTVSEVLSVQEAKERLGKMV